MTQIKLSSLLLLTFSFFFGFENSSRGEEWKNLIDNTSLSNWEKVGGDATYTLQDGVITGRTGPGKNTYLTCGPFSDFELEFDVRRDAELGRQRIDPSVKLSPSERSVGREVEDGEAVWLDAELLVNPVVVERVGFNHEIRRFLL